MKHYFERAVSETCADRESRTCKVMSSRNRCEKLSDGTFRFDPSERYICCHGQGGKSGEGDVTVGSVKRGVRIFPRARGKRVEEAM
jgi:hypothetical protein